MKIQQNQTNFNGRNVFLIDGGGHGHTMNTFTKAVFRNLDAQIKFMPTDMAPVQGKFTESKSLDSMKNNLKAISQSANKGDLTIIPALALARLKNLEKAIKEVLGNIISLNPINLRENKGILLKLIQKLSTENPKYESVLSSLDSVNQRYQELWGVIQEINKLIRKGIKVYVPSGHPQDYTIKGIADERNQRDELYKYISSGYDDGGKISDIVEKVHTECDSVYNMNLLALSDARVVNVGKLDKTPHIYGAYDTLVNDIERGVHNFTPIRDSRAEIIGFSFHDEVTNEYDVRDFHDFANFADIFEYVGRKGSEVIANDKEHAQLKQLILDKKDVTLAPNKLYDIFKIFSESYITENRLDYLGKYMNRSGSRIFDLKEDKILYQKCNNEGSNRPSGASMWGSCFASINAAKRDFLQSTNV